MPAPSFCLWPVLRPCNLADEDICITTLEQSDIWLVDVRLRLVPDRALRSPTPGLSAMLSVASKQASSYSVISKAINAPLSFVLESFKPKLVTFDRAGREMKALRNVIGLKTGQWVEPFFKGFQPAPYDQTHCDTTHHAGTAIPYKN